MDNRSNEFKIIRGVSLWEAREELPNGRGEALSKDISRQIKVPDCPGVIL
jgi:hypothetical protein